jgi:hypothetical protein
VTNINFRVPWLTSVNYGVIAMSIKVYLSILLTLLSALFGTTAQSKDFVSDLANCATAPIAAAADGVSIAPKVITFTAEHSECVPKVVAVDPVLVGMTAGVIVLQKANQLPSSGEGCSNAILGPAQRAVAGMIDTTIDTIPGGGSIFPSSGRSMLTQIAKGEGTATLYQVPGMSMVVEDLSCGCAISETGLGIEQLKGSAGTLLKGITSCTSVVNDLFGGGYEAGKAGANAVASAATAVYESFKNAANAVGCAIGLGGCPDKAPPFFCVGYQALRGQGLTPETMKAAFGGGVFAPGFDANAPICEQDYKNKLAAAEKAERDAAEQRRLARELETAQRVASTYALRFAFDWVPKCDHDPVCETGISLTADNFGKDLADDETIAQYGNFGAALQAKITQYSGNAEGTIKIATDRRYSALRADPNAPIGPRLIAFGCRPFLGRNGNSLCTDVIGLNTCKAYVDAGKWSMCAMSANKTFYSSGRALSVMMRSIGCIPEDGSGMSAPTILTQMGTTSPRMETGQLVRGLGAMTARAPDTMSRSREQGLAVQCISAGARQNCGVYKTGGSAVICKGANATPILALTPITLTPDLARPLPILRLQGLRRPSATPPAPETPPPLILQPRALPPLRRPG